MRIDVYCVDGSPTGVIPADIHERGVGGAELALLTWAPQMAKRGFEVRVYNDPREVNTFEGVAFLPRAAFNPKAERDVFIAFRGPNPFLRERCAPRVIFWSCDQYTAGDYNTNVFPFVDHTITISPFHTKYFQEHYAAAVGRPMHHIDIGVRTWEYDSEIEKVPGQFIYCSVPGRGLDRIRTIWPRVRSAFEHATLVITGDYRLWGAPQAGDHRERAMLAALPGIKYLGKVPRAQLVLFQRMSVAQLYPCTYEELFCIATAECQVAGAIPLTTDMGALATTNIHGIFGASDDDFVHHASVILEADPTTLRQQQDHMRRQAFERFNWGNVGRQWETFLKDGAA